METHIRYPRLRLLSKIVGSAVLVGYGLAGPLLEDMMLPVLQQPYSHAAALEDIVTFPADGDLMFDGSDASIRMASSFPNPGT